MFQPRLLFVCYRIKYLLYSQTTPTNPAKIVIKENDWYTAIQLIYNNFDKILSLKNIFEQIMYAKALFKQLTNQFRITAFFEPDLSNKLNSLINVILCKDSKNERTNLLYVCMLNLGIGNRDVNKLLNCSNRMGTSSMK
ncbi:hypothetical protein FACS1894113_3540 [Alphaproteobacteria bacterium]|nr:hypothetical protein FACS1894113_3540 [Alphaproteobacteria bacterium]